MPSDCCQPTTPPLVVGSLSSTVAFQRQPRQQLRTAQRRPSQGGVVEGCGEFIGFSYEMAGTGGGHTNSVALMERVLHPFYCDCLTDLDLDSGSELPRHAPCLAVSAGPEPALRDTFGWRLFVLSRRVLEGTTGPTSWPRWVLVTKLAGRGHRPTTRQVISAHVEQFVYGTPR